MSHAATPSHHPLRAENISFGQGAGAAPGMLLMAVGVACAAACGYVGYANVGGVTAKHALAAYHVGAMSVLAMCLGAMFFSLVFHLLQAGWVATIRRQFENVVSFLPIAFVLVMPTLIIEYMSGGKLFKWLSDAPAGNYVLEHKASYFFLGGGEIGQGHTPFPTFFVIRAVLYGLVWFYLSRRIIELGRRQDQSSDATPFAQARFTSAWGMLIFALTTAFAAFDWLMSLDYKFFSTMWGVYYFAGAAFSSSALVALMLAAIRMRGKLEGAVTSEHFHDLGKLMFSFTVFWAYISFSQYFLIWYSNIPEETNFMKFRSEHYGTLGVTLMVGHFVAPFLILMFRKVKRTPGLLMLVALWALAIHVLDIYWIVRPMVYAMPSEAPAGPVAVATDVLGALGPVLILAGHLVKRIGATPLVGVGDPFMHESLEHRNYV
ncbi:MAG: hypothetical protein RL689_261 [Planctomycetota bacterium]